MGLAKRLQRSLKGWEEALTVKFDELVECTAYRHASQFRTDDYVRGQYYVDRELKNKQLEGIQR